MTDTRERLLVIFRRFSSGDADHDSTSGKTQSWDSITLINVILAVEQEFAITLTPEEASVSTSFDALYSFVESKVGRS